MQLTEMQMTELSDSELDAVSGGFLDFLNTVVQSNVGANVNLSVLSAVTQILAQSNTSNI
jgi:bacteriocin-like protein